MPEKKYFKDYFPKTYPKTGFTLADGKVDKPTSSPMPPKEKVVVVEDIQPNTIYTYNPYTKQSPVQETEYYKPNVIPSTSVKIDVGIRYDDGKLPMHLLPPELMIEVAKVLDFGAKKYAPRNWELGMDWSRVYGSLMRHLIKWQAGEDIDPETGLNHIAHVACNAAFLLAYINREKGKDDRPKDS